MSKKELQDMSKIDVELVKRKIDLLEDDLKNLDRFRALTFEEYSKNGDVKAIVERTLEKLTGRLIDINYHILREEYEILPKDYRSSFMEMGKNNVVTKELANEISGAASLRNALAHEYEEIDDGKVYESISMALTQVPKYLQKIIEFIEVKTRRERY